MAMRHFACMRDFQHLQSLAFSPAHDQGPFFGAKKTQPEGCVF
ncbi:hypothetical protein [Pseudomonas sp. PDM14]|nr:hypothetical protein [Pseudomonas sp. PDM14]